MFLLKCWRGVSEVAYWLELPSTCQIHPVVHISQLKSVLGSDHTFMPLPETLVLSPEDLLDYRYDETGTLDVLVK